MIHLAIRLGDWIDAFWKALGLDYHAYAQRQPARAERLGVWCLAAGQTIGYAGLYYIFAALLLTWDNSFDWVKEALTLAFMISILVGAAVSPLAGRIVDKGIGRWLLSGGMALGALALVFLGTAQSYTSFLLSWVFIGVSQGFCLYEPCFAFITRTTGARSRQQKVTRICTRANRQYSPRGLGVNSLRCPIFYFSSWMSAQAPHSG